LNFYIRYIAARTYNNRGNQGYYNVKSRYYTHYSSKLGGRGKFTFNNPEKYSIISDFEEHDDIRFNGNGAYPDIIKAINTGNQVLNWILLGKIETHSFAIMKGRPKGNVVIDTVVFVDLNDYSKAEILYDYTGKLNIIKKFVDKARYWSGVRLKAQEEYSPEKLRSQGYFDSTDLSQNFNNLNLNSFGKKPRRVSKATKPKGSKKVTTRLRRAPGGTKRVSKTRKAPEKSATLFQPWDIERGIDGNLWMVTEYKNGIKRWTRY
jgi:hypothetical protein